MNVPSDSTGDGERRDDDRKPDRPNLPGSSATEDAVVSVSLIGDKPMDGRCGLCLPLSEESEFRFDPVELRGVRFDITASRHGTPHEPEDRESVLTVSRPTREA